jgi:hypothetical protein
MSRFLIISTSTDLWHPTASLLLAQDPNLMNVLVVLVSRHRDFNALDWRRHTRTHQLVAKIFEEAVAQLFSTIGAQIGCIRPSKLHTGPVSSA